MTENEKKAYLSVLLDFVKRAASKGATAEEVEALPAVAEIIRAIEFTY